jgi:hypothetical protein
MVGAKRKEGVFGHAGRLQSDRVLRETVLTAVANLAVKILVACPNYLKLSHILGSDDHGTWPKDISGNTLKAKGSAQPFVLTLLCHMNVSA